MSKNDYILIVEDNAEDFEVTMRSLKKVGMPASVRRCADGDEAMELLFGDSKAITQEHPKMILLDLNLPGTNGKQVLNELKSSKLHRSIPVIILTTSNNELDVKDCYSSGANCYIQKPMDFSDYIAAAETLKDFWFDLVSLPE